LPACRTLGTNNCFIFFKKRKGKTEKKKKQDKKRKKEEFSKDYPPCHFNMWLAAPFKCHFGALMWARDTLTEIF